MNPHKDNPKREGERRKGEAFANLEVHREWILLKARRVFAAVLLEKGRATIDDVRAVVILPVGLNPTCFGPVATPFARQRFVERAGFTETTRCEGHARPVSIWELKSPHGVAQWLLEHPDRPPPAGAAKEQQSLWPVNETSPLVDPNGPVDFQI